MHVLYHDAMTYVQELTLLRPSLPWSSVSASQRRTVEGESNLALAQYRATTLSVSVP